MHLSEYLKNRACLFCLKAATGVQMPAFKKPKKQLTDEQIAALEDKKVRMQVFKDAKAFITKVTDP